MGDEGAKRIVSAIRERSNGVLKTLVVSKSDFTEEGLLFLEQEQSLERCAAWYEERVLELTEYDDLYYYPLT